MSITFACGHCGKSFTVPDTLAGKTGRCKGCNGPILIPAAAPGRSVPSAPRQATRRVATQPDPPVEPIYGLEAESSSGREEAVEVLPARVGRAPSKGDASGKMKKRTGGPKSGDSPKRRIFPIVLGVAAFLTLTAFVVFIRQSIGEDQAAEAEVVKEFRDLVRLDNEFANLLAKVQDATNAEAESARAHTLVLQIQTMRLKLREKFILNRRHANAIPKADLLANKAAVDRGTKEITRIMDTYGAWEALGIESMVLETNGISLITTESNPN